MYLQRTPAAGAAIYSWPGTTERSNQTSTLHSTSQTLLLQLLASRIVCRSVYDYVTGLLPLPLLLMLFMLDGGKSDQNPEPEMRWMGMRMRGGRRRLQGSVRSLGGVDGAKAALSYIFIFPQHKRDCLQIHFILRQRNRKPE